jgi:broad specificity phosphatase PhoE
MDKGDFAGKELEEVRDTNPEWYGRLEKDPFMTRYESHVEISSVFCERIQTK